MDASEVKKLFVGGLPRETNEETLRDHFKQFGEVEECLVIRERSSGIGRGFGFVTFADCSMADKALRFGDQNHHLMLGKKIDVKVATPKDSGGGSNEEQKSGNGNKNKIFVGGLPDELTDKELREYFDHFGTITDAVVMHDKQTGRPRGFGFITFDSEDAMEQAMEQNSYKLKNKLVEVKRAEPKPKDMNDNNKYINIYDIYNTGLGYYGYPPSYSPYFSPILPLSAYPVFPTADHYYRYHPCGFYVPLHSWPLSYTDGSSSWQLSSRHHHSNGNSNGDSGTCGNTYSHVIDDSLSSMSQTDYSSALDNNGYTNLRAACNGNSNNGENGTRGNTLHVVDGSSSPESQTDDSLTLVGDTSTDQTEDDSSTSEDDSSRLENEFLSNSVPDSSETENNATNV